MGAKCNTMSTEGEKEPSWYHKEHDSSIITCTFFITRGSTQWVYSVRLFFSLQEQIKDIIIMAAVHCRAGQLAGMCHGRQTSPAKLLSSAHSAARQRLGKGMLEHVEPDSLGRNHECSWVLNT